MFVDLVVYWSYCVHGHLHCTNIYLVGPGRTKQRKSSNLQWGCWHRRVQHTQQSSKASANVWCSIRHLWRPFHLSGWATSHTCRGPWFWTWTLLRVCQGQSRAPSGHAHSVCQRCPWHSGSLHAPGQSRVSAAGSAGPDAGMSGCKTGQSPFDGQSPDIKKGQQHHWFQCSPGGLLGLGWEGLPTGDSHWAGLPTHYAHQGWELQVLQEPGCGASQSHHVRCGTEDNSKEAQ